MEVQDENSKTCSSVSSCFINLFCGIYLKFFSTINSYINTYIVQVGIYKQDENANEMIKKLSDLGKPNYKYQKDNNFVVITGVFWMKRRQRTWGIQLVKVESHV